MKHCYMQQCCIGIYCEYTCKYLQISVNWVAQIIITAEKGYGSSDENKEER